jgi:hypothetical protein
MTATLSAQAAREALANDLMTLTATCQAMLEELQAGNISIVHTYYDGSVNGLFWGPATRIKKAMGKLK